MSTRWATLKRLTDADIRRIQAMRKNGSIITDLAVAYGVAKNQIETALLRDTEKKLSDYALTAVLP